jgi:hypothetical protein
MFNVHETFRKKLCNEGFAGGKALDEGYTIFIFFFT